MNISLRDSVRYNVTSVIEMMNLCRKIKNLKSVVVASTAYSNSNLDVIEEKIYKSPISPELAFKLCAELDDSVLTEITPL